MSPDRKTAVTRASASFIAALLCSAALAAPPQDRDARRKSSAAESHYLKGLDHYAQGRRALALASFQEALRLDPQSTSARSAVRRITVEISRSEAYRQELAAPAMSAAAQLEESIDDYLVRQVPRYFRFERTVGDALTSQGTLEAMHGRVAQLMGERRLSLARHVRFGKERELRALIRRLPSVIS